jgi:hypothetical protein
MIKKLVIIALFVSLVVTFSGAVFAAPYDNYVYSLDGTPRLEPQAYLPSEIINGTSLGIDSFNSPKDICVGKDSKVYILDSGNNRVVIINKDNQLIKIIKDFEVNGKMDSFKNPQGLFVSQDNSIYVADTDHSRIVKLNADNHDVKIVGKPSVSVQKTNFVFNPIKISVDTAGRMYVVSKGETSGILELDSNGNFMSFFGAIQTSPSLSEIFWSRFMTKEQKQRSNLIIPTEYNSIAIDDQDFVYGTISAIDSKALASNIASRSSALMPIRKLNPLGSDILRRLGSYPPVGDVFFKTVNDVPLVSKISDVCIYGDGIYSMLDKQNDRIFTYDNDGNLLFVFGCNGDSFGSFGMPEAIDINSDKTFYVIDSGFNQIVTFLPTTYANLVIKATTYRFNMEYENAEKTWADVIKYSSSSDLAYNGMGASLMRQGSYYKAMVYYKLGHDKTDYSIAFNLYRQLLVEKYFSVFMTFLVILIVSIVVIKITIIRQRKRAVK